MPQVWRNAIEQLGAGTQDIVVQDVGRNGNMEYRETLSDLSNREESKDREVLPQS